ncbi:MAG: hypothetical protein J6Q39_08285 [Bacteroidales bacterium]|nr:hypothetical protein [Bacteroidales bacterium]
MKATKNIDIYLIGKRPVKSIDVVQYDTGIQLVFTVKDFTIPSGATATLYVQKPSGKFVYQKENITVANKSITVDLENQALTEYGRTPYQMTISSGSDTVTSFAGLMIVERSLKDAGAVESTSVIKAFDEVTADKIAEFQASARAIADAVIETIPDDYTELSAKVNESANAIKGHLSGAVVAADDVSPVEHVPKIWVHGKNLLNIPETTVEGNYAWCNANVGSFELAPGTYTLSVDFLQQGADVSKVSISARKYESITVQHASTSSTEKSGRMKLTFTIPDDEKGFTLYAYSNVTATAQETSCVFSNFQIEKGSVATEYASYIDASAIELTQCGKAIFSKSSQSVSGNNKAWASLLVAAVKVPPGDYVASCRFKQIGTDKTTISMSIRTYNDYAVPFGDVSSSAIEGNLEKHFVVTPGSGGFQIFLYSNTLSTALTTECSFENICVEAGTEATGYEVYKGIKYTPNSDGVVEGVTSLSPNMTLLTDTEGVIVECEYNKDTNKVVQKLADALGITI